MTQVAGAKNDKAAGLIHAKDVTDLSPQLDDVVAITLLSELTKAAQILSDLRGGDAHAFAKGTRRDTHYAVGVQFVQIMVVTGETSNDCVGNVLFFHKRVFLIYCIPYHYCTVRQKSCQLF